MSFISVTALTSLETVADNAKIHSYAMGDECAFARTSHSHHCHNDIGGTRFKLRGMVRLADGRHDGSAAWYLLRGIQ